MAKREKIEELKESIRFQDTRMIEAAFIGSSSEYIRERHKLADLEAQLAALEAEERDE